MVACGNIAPENDGSSATQTSTSTANTETQNLQNKIATLPSRCQNAITDCFTHFGFQITYTYDNFCTLLTVSINGVTGKDYMISSGCSQSIVLELMVLTCRSTSATENQPQTSPKSSGSSVTQSSTTTDATISHERNFEQELSSFSHMCQSTIHDCISQSPTRTRLYNEQKFCELLNFSENGVTSKECLMNGDCTEQNFNVLKVLACGNITGNINNGRHHSDERSGERKAFDNEVESLPLRCRNSVRTCLIQSVQGQLLYDEDRFCEMINLNVSSMIAGACSTGLNCTENSFRALKLVACGSVPPAPVETTTKDKLTAKIETFPKWCQHTISSCLTLSQTGLRLYNEEKFCELLNLEDNGMTAQECITAWSCTATNFYELKDLACGTQTVAEAIRLRERQFDNKVESFARVCKSAIYSCISQSSTAFQLYSDGAFCQLMKLTENGDTIKNCLTTSGCSENNFNELQGLACGIQPTENEKSVARKSFDDKIKNLTQECQFGFTFCIVQSAEGRRLYHDEQFCQLVNLNQNGVTAKDCVQARCSKTVFNEVKEVACSDQSVTPNEKANISSPERKAFDNKVATLSQGCQNTTRSCFEQSEEARRLYNNGQFCQLANLEENGVTAKDCLTRNDCTESDYNQLRDLACGNQPQMNSKSAERRNFEAKIATFSARCQDTLSFCRSQSVDAQRLYNEDKFCELFSLNQNGLTAKDCVTGGACTESVFNELKQFVCGAQNMTVDKKTFDDKVMSLSQGCQNTVLSCKNVLPEAQNLYTSMKFCELMRLGENGASTRQCLTQGRCTVCDVDDLTDVACGIQRERGNNSE